MQYRRWSTRVPFPSSPLYEALYQLARQSQRYLAWRLDQTPFVQVYKRAIDLIYLTVPLSNTTHNGLLETANKRGGSPRFALLEGQPLTKG